MPTGGAATVLTVLKVFTVIGIGVGAFVLGSGDLSYITQSASGASCEGVQASAIGPV